jgi:hypothetical protein
MASSIIRKSGIVLARLVGVVAIAGIAALMLLPKTVRIERSAVVSAAPNAVFAVLSSPQ